MQPAAGEVISPSAAETVGERSHERVPGVGEVQVEVSQLAMPALPLPVLSQTGTASAATQSDGSPAAAADDDLIEREWVDKAKAIIAATKDDPYRREREINKLQIDYIRKRYGRTIGDSGE